MSPGGLKKDPRGFHRSTRSLHLLRKAGKRQALPCWKLFKTGSLKCGLCLLCLLVGFVFQKTATANHHQNTPRNHTKTQRHTTHEKCLTSLSEALKEEVLQMHLRPPLPQRQTTIRIRPKTRQKRSATPPTKTA